MPMVVDAGGRRDECECGCGEKLPPWRGTGRRQQFVDDTHRQRANRALDARRDALAIWDALQILDERPALAALAACSAAALAEVRRNLNEALSAYSDQT